MLALVMQEPFDGPDRTAVRSVPVPEPGAGEVTIDVAYAGVNFIDVMARRGDPRYATGWPFVPGLEVAGRVRQVGVGVTGVATGDRVAALTGSGGLASVATAPAALVAKVPEGVPLRAAATAPAGLVTAWLLLADAGHVHEGDRVLVHSASGGVGQAVAALAPHLGTTQLLGTVGRPEKIQDTLAAGYDTAFARDETTAQRIREHTAAEGVDVILDPLGTTALELDVQIAAVGARIVLFGNASGATPSPLPGLGQLIGGNLTVTGFSLRGLAAGAPHRVGRALQDVLALLGNDVTPPPATELDGLEDVPRVHELLANGRGSGKYVARIRDAADP